MNGIIVRVIGINAFIVIFGDADRHLRRRSAKHQWPFAFRQQPGRHPGDQGFKSGRIEVALPCAAIGAVLIAVAAVVAFRARRTAQSLPPVSLGMALTGACLLTLATYQRQALTLSMPVIYAAIHPAIVWFVLTLTTLGRRI